MTESRFYEELGILGIDITETQKQQFRLYFELLVEWNQKVNLTAITDQEQVYLKHFYDSATLVKMVSFDEVGSLCDIGTGAGFPGLVLKILFPNLEVTLIDALNKRILFLKAVIQSLHLEKIEVVHARAEDYAKEHREQFDIVTSRAVSSLPVLLEYSIPLVKINGFFIPMKANIAQEIVDSKHAIQTLYVELVDQIQFQLPLENSQRTILKFRKIKKTEAKFPRKFSEIKKKHL